MKKEQNHEIKLSKMGLEQFPALKTTKFYLLRWHRSREENLLKLITIRFLSSKT